MERAVRAHRRPWWCCSARPGSRAAGRSRVSAGRSSADRRSARREFTCDTGGGGAYWIEGPLPGFEPGFEAGFEAGEPGSGRAGAGAEPGTPGARPDITGASPVEAAGERGSAAGVPHAAQNFREPMKLGAALRAMESLDSSSSDSWCRRYKCITREIRSSGEPTSRRGTRPCRRWKAWSSTRPARSARAWSPRGSGAAHTRTPPGTRTRAAWSTKALEHIRMGTALDPPAHRRIRHDERDAAGLVGGRVQRPPGSRRRSPRRSGWSVAASMAARSGRSR